MNAFAPKKSHMQCLNVCHFIDETSCSSVQFYISKHISIRSGMAFIQFLQVLSEMHNWLGQALMDFGLASFKVKVRKE